MKVTAPSPALAHVVRSGTLSPKGRGKESVWLGFAKRGYMKFELDIGQ
jgi:hypothetical protein